MDAIETVDSLIAAPVLVFGSLPPAGRDLDLLARPPEAATLARGLAEAGFLERGRHWARFRNCSVELVELVPAEGWRLPEAELSALFEHGAPIAGTTHLLAPAAHHVLLIMARKLRRQRGRMAEKHRRRIKALTDGSPAAWEEALARAGAWEADRALRKLQDRFLATCGRRSIAMRARAAGDLIAVTGRAGIIRATRRRSRRRGAIVALSGLDGCGKSSQAEHLRLTMAKAGLDTVVEWTSIIDQPPILAATKRAVNRALAAVTAKRSPAGESHGSADRVRAFRRRNRFASLAWSTFLAASNATRQRRRVRRHLRRGRIVACDRYALDAFVHLRYGYDEARSFALQALLIRSIPPKPDLAYFLDVPAEVATARKGDYDVADNASRARLYRAFHDGYGARRLDGTQRPERICSLIAEDVWQLLGRG